jgi:cell division septation protein DedD
MRLILAAILAGAAAAWCSADELSAEAQALQQRLLLRVSPSVRAWVTAEAQRVRSDPQWGERHVRVDAQAQFAGQTVIGNDLDALVFMVYAETVRQLGREISRPPASAEPPRKAEGKKKAPATNTVAKAIVSPDKERTDQRAKLAERADELARQLSALSETLLQNIR